MLVPGDQLSLSVSVEITKELVVMFVAGVVLNDATGPGLPFVEIRIWILPPPDFIVRGISPKDQCLAHPA